MRKTQMHSLPKRHVVMLGTDFRTKGGISSVVNVYREMGLFHRFPVIYLASHIDGGTWSKIAYFIKAWLRYASLLLRGRVGVVHVHMATDLSFWRKFLFLVPTYTAGVPAILHLHSGDFDVWYEHGSRWRKWAIRNAFDRARSIIVLSRSWQKWAQSISSNSLIIPIYNPVRVPQLVDFSVRDANSVLFLGQLGNLKGTYDLLQAVARVVRRHPAVRLVLAGDGEVERVREEVIRLGLQQHVEVHDWVSGERKEALLERASIYALPSYCEGLPMSVLEAMANGLPIICTPVGGIPEAVTDGLEGRLIVPGDVDALCTALDDLLSRRDLCQQMGQAARKKVEERFSAARILPQVEQLYLQLGVQRCQP